MRLFVEVDKDEVLADLSNDDLLDALRHRQITMRNEDDGSLRDFAKEALAYMNEGRLDDATLVLERALHPKWRTSADAARMFRKAVPA